MIYVDNCPLLTSSSVDKCGQLGCFGRFWFKIAWNFRCLVLNALLNPGFALILWNSAKRWSANSLVVSRILETTLKSSVLHLFSVKNVRFALNYSCFWGFFAWEDLQIQKMLEYMAKTWVKQGKKGVVMRWGGVKVLLWCIGKAEKHGINSIKRIKEVK